MCYMPWRHQWEGPEVTVWALLSFGMHHAVVDLHPTCHARMPHLQTEANTPRIDRGSAER